LNIEQFQVVAIAHFLLIGRLKSSGAWQWKKDNRWSGFGVLATATRDPDVLIPQERGI
jgi:hypothetical protein